MRRWHGMLGVISRIRKHLSDPDSDHRKIVTGFFWVGSFVFIGKLAGAAKEMAIAWRYGVSETVDAYVFIFTLVSWPVAVWSSVLTAVLVPLLARMLHENTEDLPCFRAELLGLTAVIGVVFGLIAWLGIPWLFRLDLISLSSRAVNDALNMVSGLSLLIPFGALISLFSAWMLALGRHRNTLFEAIPALAILFALLFPSGLLFEPLLWGTVTGVALQMVALATSLKQREELKFPLFGFKASVWKDFWNGIGIMAIGQMLMSFTGIIDQFFAAGLGTGALSRLSYANRILALILGVTALAISRATLPVFSDANIKNTIVANKLALRWAKWVFILSIAVLIAGVFAANFLVHLLFERGAFTAEDSNEVATIFKILLLQLPFYAFTLTLVNLMASQKKYGTLFLSGLVGIAVKSVAAVTLMPYMGLIGLALSVSFMYIANSILFYYYVQKDIE